MNKESTGALIMEIATATASNPVANNAVTNAANLAVISNESNRVRVWIPVSTILWRKWRCRINVPASQ